MAAALLSGPGSLTMTLPQVAGDTLIHLSPLHPALLPRLSHSVAKAGSQLSSTPPAQIRLVSLMSNHSEHPHPPTPPTQHSHPLYGTSSVGECPLWPRHHRWSMSAGMLGGGGVGQFLHVDKICAVNVCGAAQSLSGDFFHKIHNNSNPEGCEGIILPHSFPTLFSLQTMGQIQSAILKGVACK